MSNAETLEDVLSAIEQQTLEDERRRAIENPTPWFQLLHYPSRAAWRSTDHILGAHGHKEASVLSQTQTNLIRHAGRTNKQLQRTYNRIMEAHQLFAMQRERERRAAANLSRPQQLEGEPDGSIKDGKGREVGSWRDKKRQPPPAAYCDDPSVALALSVGLGHSKLDATGEAILDTLNVKSAKAAGKLAKSKSAPTKDKDKTVGYGPEQALTNMKYRLGPNYSIVRRVLLEVQSLLGGKPPEGSTRAAFRPSRVLDFGSGVGASAAAALDVFGVRRRAAADAGASANGAASPGGIDWIHSIDASRPMREATEKVLKSVLEDAPWDAERSHEEADGDFDEDYAEYERVMRSLRGDTDQRQIERQRKRQQRWKHSWEKRSDHRTRLTFGESIADASAFYADQVEKLDRPPLPWQKQLDEQRQKAMEKKAQPHSQKGSFDLILCSYTLSEMPDVTSGLAAAALLWEKLAPNGVMVFVEPGTPDGFGTLRSVRSMLLECCPPPELAAKRRAALEKAQEGSDDDAEEASAAEESWPEECHVIAPCTHNGTCPMIRHQRDHVKKKGLFGKYEAATPQPPRLEGGDVGVEEAVEAEVVEEAYAEESTKESSSLLSEWEGLSEEEKEEMKVMLGAEDASEEELEAMMKYIDENELFEDDDEDDDDYDSGEEDEDESDDEDEEDSDMDVDDYYNIDPDTDQSKSTMKQTGAFDTAFCSFVHNFPGGTSRRKGEKFSYLVLQKRVPSDAESKKDQTADSTDVKEQDALDVDIVELLSKSVYHSNKVKEEELQMRKDNRDFNSKGYADDDEFRKEYFEKTYDPHHREQLSESLQNAVWVEDQFLDSKIDSLGLELINGNERRKGWGRLIRAPLKKKGHVLLDYCSSGCGGCDKSSPDDDGTIPDGTKGKITRQKVSRGWSNRTAPGCYSAARKARWGGLWPDLSERVKAAERKDGADRRGANE